ncbi:MAG: nucleotidyltransferase domain-containing protein [Candidatus Kapabacteria bacterium]|nr:nucleotidyltransferase domain-containing protein [Candidatus Kapabacteria bacterium]
MFTQKIAIDKVRLFIDELIKSGIRLEKTYLFGSYSFGNQRVDSDIDLALISDMFSGFGYDDRKLLSGTNIKKEYIDIEPITFSYLDFKKGNPFIDEILRTGIEINF